MNLRHENLRKPAEFNLARCLAHVAHLLPSQGPIQDFIHHNTLHALQAQPFAQAVLEAEKIYGGRPYMPLSFYRQAAKAGRIDPSILRQSMRLRLAAAQLPERLSSLQL